MNPQLPYFSAIKLQGVFFFIIIFLAAFLLFLFVYRRNLSFLNVSKSICYAFGIDLMLITIMNFRTHIAFVFPFEGQYYLVSDVLIILAVFIGGLFVALTLKIES